MRDTFVHYMRQLMTTKCCLYHVGVYFRKLNIRYLVISRLVVLTMGEKLYRSLTGADEHLLKSKENPDHVRGLSRDAENKNPNIPEFEEIDLDDLLAEYNDSYSHINSASYADISSQEEDVHLSIEQKEAARILGEELAQIIIAGSTSLFQKVIAPWWKDHAWPAIARQGNHLKIQISKICLPRKFNQPTKFPVEGINKDPRIDKLVEPILIQMNVAFEMEQPETQEQVVNLYHHLLDVTHRVQVIGRGQIHQKSKSDKIATKREKELDLLLVLQLSNMLNTLLANHSIRLDTDTMNKMLTLTNERIASNRAYVPVQLDKIATALNSIQKNPAPLRLQD